MVGSVTVSLGLGLATLSCMVCDSDARCSPRAQDSALTIGGIETPFDYKQWHSYTWAYLGLCQRKVR